MSWGGALAENPLRINVGIRATLVTMPTHVMPAREAATFMAALADHGVDACVGGGWAVDALLGKQTRDHSDLDLWLEAQALEGLFRAFVPQGLARG